MFDRFQIVMAIVTAGLALLVLPPSARASEPSHTAVVSVVLTDGDTLQAVRVRPAAGRDQQMAALDCRFAIAENPACSSGSRPLCRSGAKR